MSSAPNSRVDKLDFVGGDEIGLAEGRFRKG